MGFRPVLTIRFRHIVINSQETVRNLAESMHRLAANTKDIRKHTLENNHGLINLNAKFDLSNGSLQDLHTLVQSFSSSVAAELSQLKENQDWMATVQDFLPEGVQGAIFNKITAAVENASQRRCASSQRVRHQKIMKPSAQPREEGAKALGQSPLTGIPASEDPDYHWKNVNPSPDVKMPRPPKYKKRVYTWTSTTFLGQANVEVDEISNDPWYERGFINVKINIGPNRWLATRAVRLHLTYDKTHGLSSPTDIRLLFPRIRPWADDIRRSIKWIGNDYVEFEKFVNLFQERGCHPNDLYRDESDDDISLLNVSRSILVVLIINIAFLHIFIKKVKVNHLLR